MYLLARGDLAPGEGRGGAVAFDVEPEPTVARHATAQRTEARLGGRKK